MDLAPDFKDLLAEFARAEVEAVLVGAAAALARLGAPENVVEGVRNMGATDVVFIGQPPLRIDFLRTIEGVEASDLFERAVDAKLLERVRERR